MYIKKNKNTRFLNIWNPPNPFKLCQLFTQSAKNIYFYSNLVILSIASHGYVGEIYYQIVT